jgi:hypothetical protein
MSVMLDLYKEGVISAQQLNRRMDVDDEQMVYELNVREATPTSSNMGNSQNNPSQAGEMNSAGTQPAVSNTQENDG